MRWAGPYVSGLLGLLGWALLVFAPSLTSAPALPSGATGMGMFALFVVVIMSARSMAFRVADNHVMSLDSVFYVAAAFCLGSTLAGRLVALALTLDALLRMALAQRRDDLPEGGGIHAYGYVLFFGGTSGGLLFLCSWLFRVDGHSPGVDDQAALAAHVVAVAVTFLLGTYALKAVRAVALGSSLGRYLRQQALPSIVAELLLIPIGILLVVLYQPSDRLAFLLLCATYLLLHYVFTRLRRLSEDLQRRVRDLESLSETARTVASALELEELVVAVAREACRAVPSAEAVALVHRGAERDTERLIVDSYDRETDSFHRFSVRRNEGVVGRVVESRLPLLVGDLPAEDLPVGDGAGVRSWLGVPIVIGDGVEGVLSIQSTQRNAFGPSELRLVEAIGHQVATALQNAHLYQMAMVDSLTGLFVRRYFDARIEEEIERSRRYGTPFSVVMIDIDDFKLLNDTHGHLAGDRVLRSVAAALRGQMRGVDTAARYGGEELAVILPRTEMVAAYNQAERIRAAIAEHRVTGEPGATQPTLTVTASFGIAAFPESQATTGEDLVRRADRALYRAKRMGKNRVELFWADDSDAPVPVATT